MNADILENAGEGIEHLIVKTILEDEVAEQLATAQAELETLKKYFDENSTEIQELKETISSLKSTTNSATISQITAALANAEVGSTDIYTDATLDPADYGLPGEVQHNHYHEIGRGVDRHRISVTFDENSGIGHLSINNGVERTINVRINSDVVFRDVQESVKAVVDAAYTMVMRMAIVLVMPMDIDGRCQLSESITNRASALTCKPNG